MTEFHLSCPWIWIRRGRRRQHFKLWICFNGHDRREGHYWGFGVLQIGCRHLLAAIRNSDHPRIQVWLGFMRVYGKETQGD